MAIEPTRLPRRWTLVDYERPWTANAERTWHFQKRARVVREWRERFAWLARGDRIPPLQRISVAAVPLVMNRRSLPDVGACFPAVKAAVDGLVDAGVIPDDSPQYVHSICFYAPLVGDLEGLRLVVTEDFSRVEQ